MVKKILMIILTLSFILISSGCLEQLSGKTTDDTSITETDPVATGSMLIKSVPLAADVYVNGKKRGITPLLLTDLKEGKYKVKIVKENHKDFKKTIIVRHGEKTNVITKLRALYGHLKVKSTPTGAEVFLDGVKKGDTPLIFKDLKPGKYDLIVTKDGYISYNEEVVIKRGRTKNIKTGLEQL